MRANLNLSLKHEIMNHVNEIFFNDVFKSFSPYMLYILDKKQYPILGMDE